jgi:hypothetical protein
VDSVAALSDQADGDPLLYHLSYRYACVPADFNVHWLIKPLMSNMCPIKRFVPETLTLCVKTDTMCAMLWSVLVI